MGQTSPTDGWAFLHEARRVRLTYVTHAHDALELLVVVGGSGRFHVQGREVVARRNDLLWLFPGQPHAMLAQNELRMWVVQFSRRLVEAQARILGDPHLLEGVPAGALLQLLDPDELDGLAAVCGRVAALDLPDQARNQGLAWLLLAAWTAGRHAGRRRPSLSVQVERAVRLLDTGETSDRLTTLAAACGCSPAWLSRRFHAEVGMTVGQYTDRRRLARFMAAWNAGGRSLTAAALEAGFGSYARFYSVFRRLAGGTPRRVLAAARSR